MSNYQNQTLHSRTQKVLGIIPARSGSKRLQNKNILKLLGKPLISWTIDAAIKSNFITDLIVSTDCYYIAKLAKSYGANVPFIRPPSLSTDKSSSFDVVRHALKFYLKKDLKFDLVIMLQPTSPLRDSSHIDKAITQIIEREDNAVISVCKAEHPPQWCNKLEKDLSMDNFLSESFKKHRSQDFSNYYRLNGAIYVAKAKTILQTNISDFFSITKTSAFEMDPEVSVDIDTSFDFLITEYLLRKKLNT